MTPQQRLLFGGESAPWEEDDRELRSVAQVVFSEAPYGPYDYAVPEPLRGRVQAGKRVFVPLGRGNRRRTGYCISVQSGVASSRRLKNVLKVVDEATLWTPSLLRLAQWLADYYLCPLGQVLETIVPSGVRGAAGTRMKTLLSVPDAVLARMAELRLPPKQRHVLEYLAHCTDGLTAQEIADRCGCSVAPVQGLFKKGLLEATERRVSVFVPEVKGAAEHAVHALTDAQQSAVDAIVAAIRGSCSRSFLLHGVTGSGKTEVYIRAIEEVERHGRQAIVLVPEISLTPQTWQRFQARFARVAVLHSQLTPQERNWHWQRIAAGQVSVVVGARSAVFAPVPQLGLIVIDEEHDPSFKQDTAPRYHARTVAQWRAQQADVPLVLGSATPSLETWQAARRGVIERLGLPRRVAGRTLPEVRVVDLRHEWKGRGALSRVLVTEMHRALDAGGQVILLLNRRGFATYIQCPLCGEVVRCPHCDIPLTHHHHDATAKCHYCDHEESAPTACGACGGTQIRYSGTGTEKLEKQLAACFPGVSCLRMDGDTMRRTGAHEKALERFRRGEVRILLGTQMIAKGLDFPGVTLVGVVNADIGLHFPDFRAAERTFQLVTQVAGRTGRGEAGGRVVVQTFSPDHPAIDAAVRHRYEWFVNHEWESRRRFGYPPASRLVRLVVRGADERATERAAEQLAEAITRQQQGVADVRVVGPAPAPFPKLRGKFRFHLLLLGPKLPVLRRIVSAVRDGIDLGDAVQWTIDVEPQDML